MIFMLTAAALLAAQTPAQQPAQTASESATADPQAIAEALRLLDAQGFEEEVFASTELSLEAAMVPMTAQIQQVTGGAIPDELIAQIRAQMREHSRATIRSNMQNIKLSAAQLYAENFTPAELAHMREIANDPVMVKARARAKVIGPRMMALGMKTMRDAQPELEARIKQLVIDYFKAHGKPVHSSS